ncbi:MAG TPA: cadherin-like beta sandwich domain-containing protein, partial [Anaerovoracaceae bacterium]|nr:cadherin-like beta sandwich domain-containing protein [Anaerovoracaceae bacterium]
ALVLSPVFDLATTFYTANTPNDEDIIMATPTDAAATIIIMNGTTVIINGTAATWILGENVMTIVITNGSAITTYTLKITKAT